VKLDPSTHNPSISRRYRYLLVTAAVLTFLLVAMGGIVCVTNSSRGCPDWPWCYGRLVPPPRLDSIIEYTHRLLAAAASLSILASAILGWRDRRSDPWVARPPAIALAFLLVVIVLGAMVVLRGLEPGLAAVDLGSALIVLALVLLPPVAALSGSARPVRFSLQSPYSRLSARALVAVFVVLVSAVLVADSGSVVRCLGWPLASARLFRGDLRGWLQLARLVAGGVAALLIVRLLVQSRRTQRGQPSIVFVTTAIGGLLLAEIIIGAVLVRASSSLWLLAIYAVLATALWSLMVIHVGLVALTPSQSSGREDS
jgi:heme a synthase